MFMVIKYLQVNYNRDKSHLGVGGKGMFGRRIYGIFTSDGLAGKVPYFIPPFAKGISGTIIGCCLKAYFATTGALNVKEGIFLMPLGLFSASNLSAYPPCFYPFDYFLMA